MRYALLLAGAVVAGVMPASAATIENFQMKTTADLVDLCSADPASDHYIAAIHFCEGFAVGAYQYYLAQAVDDPSNQYVCAPNPPPTRNDAIVAFLAWAQAHPQFMGAAPVDALFRFLGETYPCSRSD
jgi:hypothetical protein